MIDRHSINGASYSTYGNRSAIFSTTHCRLGTLVRIAAAETGPLVGFRVTDDQFCISFIIAGMQFADDRRAHGLTALRPPGLVAVLSGQVYRLLLRGLEPVRAVVALERPAGALAQFGEEAVEQADSLRLRFA